MTIFGLQITAMITMFADHLGGSLLNDYLPLRCIGRIAFLTYALLLAEGFRHFKGDDKRIRAHLSFYVVSAVVSEIAYDFLECDTFTVANLMSSQNAMITLLLAFLGLIAIEKWKDKPVNVICAVILTSFINYVTIANYRMVGVLLVYFFYFYLEHMEGKPYFRRAAELIAAMFIYFPLWLWAKEEFCGLREYMACLDTANLVWFAGHIIAALILASYTGKLGYYNMGFKKVYRWFYPAHMFVLGVIYHLFII